MKYFGGKIYFDGKNILAGNYILAGKYILTVNIFWREIYFGGKIYFDGKYILAGILSSQYDRFSLDIFTFRSFDLTPWQINTIITHAD